MASQQRPPSRPWFRLATMARPPPPAPAPQPDQPPPPTRMPAFIRPAFTQPPPPPRASPTLPKEPRPMPPSSNPRTSPLQLPTSPQPPRSTAPSFSANMAPTINRATSSPPKTVKPPEKTPPPSPNIKPLSHPPSPLALPSPKLKSYQAPEEYDQKSVLVQETKEKPKAFNNGDLPRHMARDTNNPISGAPKKPEASKNHQDSEDLGLTIITISGENKGAIMDLTPSVDKTHHKFGNKPHGLLIKKENPTASSDGEKSGSNSDGKSKAKNKNQKSKSPLMSTAVMNSNVQAVNNSILYNCSTTHHDPGIHLSVSRKPTGARGFFLKDHKDHIN